MFCGRRTKKWFGRCLNRPSVIGFNDDDDDGIFLLGIFLEDSRYCIVMGFDKGNKSYIRDIFIFLRVYHIISVNRTG